MQIAISSATLTESCGQLKLHRSTGDGHPKTIKNNKNIN